jgi:hypothetical protein
MPRKPKSTLELMLDFIESASATDLDTILILAGRERRRMTNLGLAVPPKNQATPLGAKKPHTGGRSRKPKDVPLPVSGPVGEPVE